MYPLSVSLETGKGFAVANDEAEHVTLTAMGYVPAFTGPQGSSASGDLLPPGVPGEPVDPPVKRGPGRPKKVAA